jgi:hypothetical protein
MQSGGKVDRLAQTDTVTDAEYSQYLADCDKLEAARLNTLRINAINAGYVDAEIEAKWVTEEEYVALMAALSAQPVTHLTMRQARLQMLAMGVLSQVEAAVAQAGDAAQIEWEYAMTVERDYPLFLAIKGMLGFTDEHEETFFSEGAKL